MTVATAIREAIYTGNDATTEWALATLVLDEAHISVSLYNIATDVTDPPLASSVYSITGIGDEAGITVTYPLSGTPLSSDQKIIIRRTVPYVQLTSIRNQSGFFPDVIEDQLDLIVMQTQQNAANAKLPDFPIPGDIVVINADGTGFDNGGSAGDIAGAAAAAAAAAASAAAAATSAASAIMAAAFTWNFDTSTVTADPGVNEIRFNNATVASVTEIYINETANEGGAAEFMSFWDGGHLRFVDTANPDNWAFFSVDSAQVDNGAWRTFQVTHVSSSGTAFGAADVIAVLGSTGASVTASTTETLTGTDTSKAVTPDSLAALWEKGADIASANNITIGEGGYFDVTGTVAINDIDFTNDKTGRMAWLQFDGVLTLTNSATLILPGGENITTGPGDTALFVSDGAADTVRCIAYQCASCTGGSVTEYNKGALAASTTYTQAHGLGAHPDIVQLWLECAIAEAAWSIGDRLLATTNESATAARGISLKTDTTNIVVATGASALEFLRDDTNVNVALTHANWNVIVKVITI